jgi:DnaJ family protein C protein 25
LPDGDHDRFLRDELWIRPKFDAWKKEKEAQEQEKLLNSGRYKQYRRYMKNHGPGQISFVDE